jgi:hypothetical protein
MRRHFVAPHSDRLEADMQLCNQFVAGVCDAGGHMPGDPAQCRLYAARYLELSKRAKNRARRANLAALAKLWTKLAAELESEQALLNTLAEINFDEPFYAVPEALNLRVA